MTDKKTSDHTSSSALPSDEEEKHLERYRQTVKLAGRIVESLARNESVHTESKAPEVSALSLARKQVALQSIKHATDPKASDPPVFSDKGKSR